jgi:uncharacterized membrane protein HdeD (DUF308 family)
MTTEMNAANATTFETKQMPWWLVLMGGILNVAIGLLLLTSPVKSTYTLVLVLGFYWIFAGMFTLVGMFIDHSGWGWKLLSGVISIIAGTLIIRYPIMSTLAVPAIIILVLGIQGILVGIIGLVMAFKGGGVGAGILGVLSIVFGVIICANYTSPSMILTFVWIVGVFALIGGFGQIFQAFSNRTA